jgi:lipopolysaccharide export system protein LptA
VDGKFSIEGEGFLWQQTNSTLLVSNRVHTIIHPELMGAQTATATNNVVVEQTNAAAEQAAGINVFSDQFEYAEDSGRGVYQGNVRVAGTNLTSSAGKMTIVLSAAERRLQTLEAEENVIIDYKQMHATGGQGLYSADTGLIRLTNQPTWRLEQRDGSGDELVLDQTNGVFHANGHARLQTPAQNMGVSGLLSEPGSVSSNSVPATNHFVEVLCDNYQLQTNLAVFRKEVRVSDRIADQLQGEMSCALLTLTFSGTNELQKMLAEHQVVIAQQDKQFTAEKAEYTGTNGVLDLTGNPGWRAGVREGKGDLVRVHPAREEMLVQGNAVMKFPAAELGQSAFSALGTPKRGQSKATTNEFAVVYSQEYFLTPESALFRGGVRIEHPQMKWACEEITMLSPPELGKTGRMMIAEPAVVFDVIDDQGRSYHGTGEKAVYTHRVMATLTNDIVELTGSPAMLTATNIVGQNNIMTLDLANHKLTAPGKYKLWGTAPTVTTTTLRPSKSRSPR